MRVGTGHRPIKPSRPYAEIRQTAYKFKGGKHVSTHLIGQNYLPPNFSTRDKELWLPRLIIGDHRDIREGVKPTFGSKPDWTQSATYAQGLQDYVRIESRTSPISYYFDNHSACVFAFAEAVSESLLDPGFTIVQLDDHDDSAPCYQYYINERFKLPHDIHHLSSADFLQVVNYLKCLDVAGHNDFSLISGLASQVIAVCGDYRATSIRERSIDQMLAQVNEILTFSDSRATKGDYMPRQCSPGSINELLIKMTSPRKFALVVDLDAYLLQISSNRTEDMNDETIDKIAHFIVRIAQQAGLLVVITSPGFSHHGIAVKTAQRIAFLMQPI